MSSSIFICQWYKFLFTGRLFIGGLIGDFLFSLILRNYYFVLLKGNAEYFRKKDYIMDENDSLSEYIKIPLGHNRTNGAVYSKINFKVEICFAL